MKNATQRKGDSNSLIRLTLTLAITDNALLKDDMFICELLTILHIHKVLLKVAHLH